MKKIVRLTESDLTRIVKRVISEQEKDNLADKVETTIEKPKVEMKIEDIYSQLSDEEKEELKNTLEDLGIDEYSSAKEVHSKIEDMAGDDVVNGEMSEDEDKNPRKTAAKILHAIGAANIAAWGGIPAAIGIGSALIGTVGAPMVAGFAISWGVTGLLMGLAKLIHKDSDSLNENYQRRNRRRY
jgi:hypothetical protein